ncbi:MAG: hypothetical protein KME12_15115 [Trichocoleus desertorum ATA4-8-CV12]|jgi:hypothetical protein|nr:hypothetical protein [Trichocoleus desertorum ATA4-8-CV12]
MSKRLLLESLKNGVLHVDFKGDKHLFQTETFVVKDLISRIKHSCGYDISEAERNQLFGKGIECNFLQPGADWKKGRIKMSIEFIPDETESPLDDIRQHIDSNT